MAERSIEAGKLTPEQVRFLASLAGVELGEERAAALAPQAEQHFTLMCALDAIDARGVEPAAEFRLDPRWRTGDA
jgi:Asp-tRNA(Asn)/Glu-tRNA(Gln) amidotransferase C subunit